MVIKLARNLILPVEAQTQTFALLAIRGVGKTYTCLKMAEGMHADGLQFVMVDPTGVCWGLRSSADGKRKGLPILIFGGEHGDVPLEPTSDELAELADASSTSSGYSNNLGSLRSLGVIAYPSRGQVAATDVLFLEGS